MGLFSKQKKQQEANGNVSQEKVVEAKYDISQESAIHVMPTSFKVMQKDGDEAKKVGLFIFIAGGFIFLLIIGATAYLLLGATSKKNNTKIDEKPVVENQDLNNDNISSSSVVNIAPVIENIASTTATSTENQEIEVVEVNVGTPAINVNSVKGLDTDLDGLSDAEEAIFNSDINNQDSDNDGFYDYAEVFGGYNPAGPGRLSESSRLGLYSGEKFSISYPLGWSFQNVLNDSVLFTTANNQIIQVNIQENNSGGDIIAWYKEQFAINEIGLSQLLESRDVTGALIWQGVLSIDGLTIFLSDPNSTKIVTINYNLGLSNAIEYQNLFKIMADSFRFK